MTRKQTVILIALIVFVAGGIIFGAANRINKKSANNNPPQIPPVSDSKNSGEYYTPEVPKNAELTKPESEAPAFLGATEEKFRIFDMQVNKDGYSPDSFTVNLGDTVQIKMTSVDGDYDFSMPWSGLYQFAKRGENKTITFGATSAGTFVFECRDHCPPDKVLKGTIIVLP